MKSPHAILSLAPQNQSPLRQEIIQPSGVAAIDQHYASINQIEELNLARTRTEFQRILSLIKTHWRANKFPKCEQRFVLKKIEKFFKSPNFKHT